MKTYLEFSEGLKDYTDQGKNIRVPGEDKASFRKLFKDDMKQMGKFKYFSNPYVGKGQSAVNSPKGVFPKG